MKSLILQAPLLEGQVRIVISDEKGTKITLGAFLDEPISHKDVLREFVRVFDSIKEETMDDNS